jgi:hypothetical protein
MLTNISFCLLDNYTFSNIEALVGHFDREHREQRHCPYKLCSASSSAYAQRDNLRNHLYRHEFGNCHVEETRLNSGDNTNSDPNARP